MSAGGGARSRLWLAALVLAVCALAVGRGLWTTRGVSWPFDEDLYRDIAQARTMADGGWLSDPFYEGETIWYNPLSPAIVAVVSRATGLPTNEANVRVGPWLGLLAPLGFTVLAGALLGRAGALAGLLVFVFVTPGRLPALQCATYSPWPFAAQVAQGPLYLGLAALVAGRGRLGLGRAAGTGALLGLTFLAHTAPALLLGAIAATFVLVVDRSGAWPSRLPRLGALLAVALVVASPFLWSIVGRYHLHVVNPEPGAYVWTGTGLEDVPHILASTRARPGLVALTLLGVVALVRRRPASPGAPVARAFVGAWAGWGTVLLAYALTEPVLQRHGLPLPPLVPAFHFWMLLGALVSLLTAFGLTWLGGLVASRVRTPDERRAALAGGVTVALALGLAAASYPSWRLRGDFVDARALAEFHSAWVDRIATHLWVRTHTLKDDVFLAEHDPGLRVVATAGRKLVAVDSGFSSPFVPWAPRAEAAARMLASLHPGGHEVFHPLAVRYHVSYVLVERKSASEAFPEAPFLTRVFEDGDFAVYRTGCWPEGEDP